MELRLVLLLVLVLVCHVNGLNTLNVHSDVVQEAAIFALNELKKLSDSSIYETLTLQRVVSASDEIGLFHHNLILEVELSCDHFESNRQSEPFEIIVMTHLDNGVKSIAIDEFPRMKEASIEEFQNRNIEKKKIQREEAFRRLEIEAILFGDDLKLQYLREKLAKQTVSELLLEMDTEDAARERQIASADVQSRITHPSLLSEEQVLAGLDMADLYQMSIGAIKGSDYQKYRSKTLLDGSMQFLQRVAQASG